jgi:hypothetical protein
VRHNSQDFSGVRGGRGVTSTWRIFCSSGESVKKAAFCLATQRRAYQVTNKPRNDASDDNRTYWLEHMFPLSKVVNEYAVDGNC